jgi:hypothetical protein
MKCISFSKVIYITISCFFLLYGCTTTEKSNKVDLSGISVNIKVHRFDQALFSLPPDSIPVMVPKLEKDFGPFFELFGANIIQIGNSNQRDFGPMLQKFVTDFNMQTAYSETQKNYKEVSDLTEEITKGFKYYKYYFKKKSVPELYFYMGGFNQSIVTSENILGIGLDKYLGKNCAFYSHLGLASYQSYKMQKEFIVPDCFRAVAWSEFPYIDSIDNLVSNMIYQGKIQYFMKSMLPDIPDTLLFAYTNKQWEWCTNNEHTMWAYLIDKKQLFTTTQIDIKRYVDDAPFTSTFPHDSPGRTGVWMGWQMVNKYMEQHPEITLEQLMLDNDFQKIMNGSKYNP